MGKYKIEQNLDECIGCMACQSVAEDVWEQAEVDGAFKAKPKKEEFDDDELAKVKESAEICPVQCVHIINKESGEKII
ncbi:ferredoxin [Candidatus Woesearchaeota archaeon CG10_big_fil_rev_8_21_14_0_10_34_8]|jgi:ferredoxin|nr:MAG: ferredoxin [Candidatus Woesearchaeota archaeon CG10_big_fil_rev_8_21_14_0_10_34_8]